MLAIKQISQLAHVTPRTLRYYDQIGLLPPEDIGENGYRYYSDASLLKLQQILFYRELDMPLEQIKEIMDREGYDLQEALEEHKNQLVKRINRLQKLITTVDQTLKYIKGEEEMNKKVLFDAFNEEEQEKMEKEAMQMYDPETVKESNRKWKNYSVSEKQKIGEEGNAAYQGFKDVVFSHPFFSKNFSGNDYVIIAFNAQAFISHFFYSINHSGNQRLLCSRFRLGES